MRRRVTAHTLKRRLLRKFVDLTPYQVTAIVVQLREHAIARRFLEGESLETIQRSEALGSAEWTLQRVEQALRSSARMRGSR